MVAVASFASRWWPQWCFEGPFAFISVVSDTFLEIDPEWEPAFFNTLEPLLLCRDGSVPMRVSPNADCSPLLLLTVDLAFFSESAEVVVLVLRF